MVLHLVSGQRHHRAFVAPMVDGMMDQGLWSNLTLCVALSPADLMAWLALCQDMPGSVKGWRMCSSACGVLTRAAGRSRARLDGRLEC